MLETHTGENSEILRVTRCDYHEDAVNGNAPDISINLVSEFSQWISKFQSDLLIGTTRSESLKSLNVYPQIERLNKKLTICVARVGRCSALHTRRFIV